MLLSYLDESNASNLSDFGLIYLTLASELLFQLVSRLLRKSHSGQIPAPSLKTITIGII